MCLIRLQVVRLTLRFPFMQLHNKIAAHHMAIFMSNGVTTHYYSRTDVKTTTFVPHDTQCSQYGLYNGRMPRYIC